MNILLSVGFFLVIDKYLLLLVAALPKYVQNVNRARTNNEHRTNADFPIKLPFACGVQLRIRFWFPLPRSTTGASGGRVIYNLCGIDHASLSTRQILMPYPIFRDGIRGDELLILGTKKATDLVEESRKRRNERGEIKPANLERGEVARREGDDGGFIRRRWTPAQIRRGS